MELQNKIDEMVQSKSAEMLLRNLIDYAGLFPPACLSLNEAVQNYAAYLRGSDGWMLGSYIHPASSIQELKPYVGAFSDRELSISALGRKSESYRECLKLLEEDLDTVASFEKEHRERVRITAFELPLPPSIPEEHDIEQLSVLTSDYDMTLYCEITFAFGEDWYEQMLKALDCFANYNKTAPYPIGMKLRTGGVKAEMIPAPGQLAAFIAACRDRKLPLKFTAGLHHPVRMYREEVNAKMHGYVNVFTGCLFAHKYQLGEESIKEILNEDDPSRFSLAGDKLAWGAWKLQQKKFKNCVNHFYIHMAPAVLMSPALR
ncbi:hypothetical protein [Siminovitchia sp. 179-K 8D1 HS]|uniref:hypothetical protein n=1 Tax=Siminovitchia sp. 179-K 8D1 HS TaxID=3142385 RepID=UPI0039A2160C